MQCDLNRERSADSWIHHERTVEVVRADAEHVLVVQRNDGVYGGDGAAFARMASAASFLATSSAWSAATSTSGATPVPSQFVFVIGLTARA